MKFGGKVGYDKLYCVTKSQPHIAYQSLYFFIFLSLQQFVLSQMSQLLLKPESSDFVCTLSVAKYIVLKNVYFAFFFIFSFFPSLTPV